VQLVRETEILLDAAKATRGPFHTLLGILGDAFTVNPARNPQVIVGFLWGLPVPLVALGIQFMAHDRTSWGLLQTALVLYPFLCAILGGAIGTTRHREDLHVAALIEKLERHVSELAVANDALKDVERLKARFMANVTHDLKSPLVAIRGYSESILEERFGPITDGQRRGLSVAVRNIDRLQRLIRELLEFERIDGGDCTLSLSDFDLAALVADILRDFQPVIDKKCLVVRLWFPHAVVVHADCERIGRVLTNLISNAIKFSPERGVIRIAAYAGQEDDQVLVTIEDHGPGIPTTAQARLFARYPSPHNASAEGTGLGLAICKGILDAHGSMIQIASTEGSGTIVRFDLPLAVREPQEMLR
jgi:signal transduction histidine kinase